jgi:hypothetical protein
LATKRTKKEESAEAAFSGLPEDIPSLLLEDDDEVERVYRKFIDMEEDVSAELQREGLPVYGEHAAQPVSSFPKVDIAQLNALNDPTAYSQAYKELLAWLAWVNVLRARNENSIMGAENALEVVSAKLFVRLQKDAKANGWKDDFVKASLRSHPTYIEATLALQRAKERGNLLHSYASDLDRQQRAVSRMITVRGQDTQMNIGVHRPQPSPPSSNRVPTWSDKFPP